MAANEAVAEATQEAIDEAPVTQTPQALGSPTTVTQATPTPRPATSQAPTDGTRLVPDEMPPGTYRSNNVSGSCYWQRLSGLGGTFSEIIANGNEIGPAVVTIGPGDRAFSWRRCATWSSDLGPVTSSPDAAFGDGTFVVGVDIAPGTWRAEGSSNCYWERLGGFSGGFLDIIANDNTQGSTIIQIQPGDAGFRSNRCGTWTKVADAGPGSSGGTSGAPSVPALRATAGPAGTPSTVTVNKRFGAALRAQPSSDAPIVTNVGCGAVMQVLETGVGGWYRVQSGTSQGWVGGARVVAGGSPDAGACSGAPIPPFAIGQSVRAIVQSGCLSVRPSPAADAPVVGCVPTGHQFVLTNGPVEVAGEDWFAVRSTSTGLSGWTRATYLQR